MGNKWDKERATCDGVMSATLKDIFSTKDKKEERYKLFLDVQGEMMEFDRESV